MIRRTAHRSGAALVALLPLVLGLGPSSTLVLCSSTSGHVAVESVFADDDCCSGHALPEPSRPRAAAAGCDGCTDTPLRTSVVQPARPFDRGTATTPALAALLPRAPAAVAGTVPAPGPGTDAAPPGLLRARRSVVLVL